MPSSYSASCRYELQATGENINTWGVRLDTALTLVDSSVAGWATIPLTGNVSLTSANGVADQARLAMLKFTGTGTFTVTVPAVSKRYDVWNACSGVLTVTNGSASVNVQPGEVVGVVNDGGANFARVQPTDFSGITITNLVQATVLTTPTLASHVTTKSYVDAAISAAAFSMGSFGVPIIPANAGQLLTNNGSTASWASSFTTTFTFGGLVVSGAAGTSRGLTVQTAGGSRWAMVATSTTESGGNAGSDLNINRYDDTGAYIDTPLSITRATGAVTASGQNLSKLRIRRLFANRDLI